MSELVIERIETTILDIPLIRPHKFSLLSIDTQAVLLVRVHTRDGIVGIGDGVVRQDDPRRLVREGGSGDGPLGCRRACA